jgi:hypothetical protein
VEDKENKLVTRFFSTESGALKFLGCIRSDLPEFESVSKFIGGRFLVSRY